MQNIKIIDNDRKILRDVLEEVSTEHQTLSIATWYWDLPWTTMLIESIKNYSSVRLLIWQEPMIPRHQVKLNLVWVEADFPSADIFSDLEKLTPTPELRRTVEILRDMIESKRLEVRIYRENFLHAKCYIFGDYESDSAIGIIGSSNFTKNGLTQNAELNTLESDHRIVTFSPKTDIQEYGHLSWFDAFWNKWEPWTWWFELLIRHSKVGDLTYSPYQMYIATLHHLYSDEIVDNISLSEETLKSLFPFQQRNTRLLISKLEKNRVAMLADSVWLGKTITAWAVIKHYIEKKATRICVIAPARLLTQWQKDLADKHWLVTGYKLISLQNMDVIMREQELDIYKEVDLFIIDEAHNLRNENSSRYQQILEWLAKNSESHVLLLTATPVNNNLTDFVSQIQLASKGKRTSFPVVYETEKKTDIIDFWDAVNRLSVEIKKKENAGEKPDWERVRRIMRDGLRHFLVRSTRSGIEREFGGITGTDGITKHFPTTKVAKEGYSFSKDREDGIFTTIADSINNICEW
jgi:hypothetical protein